jgi:hypothetical protein
LRVDEQKGRKNSARSKKKKVIIAPADSCPGVTGLMKTRTLVISSFLNISTPSNHQQFLFLL